MPAGRPKVEEKLVLVSVRFRTKEVSELKALADSDGRSLSMFIRRLVLEAMASRPRKERAQ